MSKRILTIGSTARVVFTGALPEISEPCNGEICNMLEFQDGSRGILFRPEGSCNAFWLSPARVKPLDVVKKTAKAIRQDWAKGIGL